MDSNSTLGDCVVAAAAHQIESWTGNSDPSHPESVSEAQVVSLYDKISPDDQGVVILDFLKRWRTGVPLGGRTDTLSAFASLNPAIRTELEQSIYLFGGAFIGLELPDAVLSGSDALAVPWALPPGGATGASWAPNPQNGHAVVLLGYAPTGVSLVTWGAVKGATWEFLAAYCDEAYALLSQTDWIDPQGTAPSGFDMAQLQTDLKVVGQTPPTSDRVTRASTGASRRRPR